MSEFDKRWSEVHENIAHLLRRQPLNGGDAFCSMATISAKRLASSSCAAGPAISLLPSWPAAFCSSVSRSSALMASTSTAGFSSASLAACLQVRLSSSLSTRPFSTVTSPRATHSSSSLPSFFAAEVGRAHGGDDQLAQIAFNRIHNPYTPYLILCTLRYRMPGPGRGSRVGAGRGGRVEQRHDPAVKHTCAHDAGVHHAADRGQMVEILDRQHLPHAALRRLTGREVRVRCAAGTAGGDGVDEPVVRQPVGRHGAARAPHRGRKRPEQRRHGRVGLLVVRERTRQRPAAGDGKIPGVRQCVDARIECARTGAAQVVKGVVARRERVLRQHPQRGRRDRLVRVAADAELVEPEVIYVLECRDAERAPRRETASRAHSQHPAARREMSNRRAVRRWSPARAPSRSCRR